MPVKPKPWTHFEVDATSEDSVGANETTVFVKGRIYPAEPDVGINRATFVIEDIVNADGISVLELIEDQDWLSDVRQTIEENILYPNQED